MNSARADDDVETRPYPRVVDVTTPHPWQIALPSVYRYENQRWIKDFFSTGRLRLSTFQKFASYPDEIRGDQEEGSGFIYVKLPDNQCLFVRHALGTNALVFCCSRSLSRNLQTAFERDSAFEILDTFGFAAEVARQLPEFASGTEGSCIYIKDTLIGRELQLGPDHFKASDGSFNVDKAAQVAAQLGGVERLLLKRKRYTYQQEYRLLWAMNSVQADYVDIVCPLARKYCREVTPEEFD